MSHTKLIIALDFLISFDDFLFCVILIQFVAVVVVVVIVVVVVVVVALSHLHAVKNRLKGKLAIFSISCRFFFFLILDSFVCLLPRLALKHFQYSGKEKIAAQR